jgi:predicted nuclease with TOPRIM domain
MDLDHERRLTEVEERSKSNQHRLDEVEAKQNEYGELVSSIKELAVREQHMENDVKEIKSDVKDLTGKSGKKWDMIVDKAITTVAAGIIAYFLAKYGL